MIDKSHMFWGTKDLHYADGHSIPRVTYRCKRKWKVQKGSTISSHQCKLVTDHPKECLCVCGRTTGEELADV